MSLKKGLYSYKLKLKKTYNIDYAIAEIVRIKNDIYCSEDAKYLNRKLKKYGLIISAKTYDDHVYDRFFEDRGKGIHKLLEKVQNVESYVVIDDHTFTDFDGEIMEHLVLTDYRNGLTDSDVEKAIGILNKTDNNSD